MVDVESYLVGGALFVLVAQAVMMWRIGRTVFALRTFDDRLTHQAAAIALLTDAVERSFGAVALEIERFSTQTRRPSAATQQAATQRVRQATQAGRTPEQIAVTERASEGEIRLRLALAEDVTTTSRTPTGREPNHGAM
jgi:hypothetical protein